MVSDQDRDAFWKVTVVECKLFSSEQGFVKSTSAHHVRFSAVPDLVTVLDEFLP